MIGEKVDIEVSRMLYCLIYSNMKDTKPYFRSIPEVSIRSRVENKDMFKTPPEVCTRLGS